MEENENGRCKIQIYGIRTVEDARMVIDMGAHHIGVSYGRIKQTPGQLTLEGKGNLYGGTAGRRLDWIDHCRGY